MTTSTQSPADDQTHADTSDEPGTPASDEHSPADEPETFDRAYVDRLRGENAELRVRTGKLDEFEARLFDLTAADVARELLRDPADLQITDRAAYLGDDGYPDRSKIRASAEELLSTKPYLARIRGDAGQGARPGLGDGFSLGAALREAAG